MRMGFDFIVIEPFLSCCLAAASSLSLDMGYLFLLDSSVFRLMVVQQLIAVLMLSQEMNTRPSTPPSLTGLWKADS